MKILVILQQALYCIEELGVIAEGLEELEGKERLLVVDTLPKVNGRSINRRVRLLCLRPTRIAVIKGGLEMLEPNSVLAIDAWAAPERLSEALGEIARVVFSMATPPAVCVVFAPPAERLRIVEQTAEAFRIRVTGNRYEFQRACIRQCLTAASFARWFGPMGFRVHRVIMRIATDVSAVLARR